jgi:hypothetical protein
MVHTKKLSIYFHFTCHIVWLWSLRKTYTFLISYLVNQTRYNWSRPEPDFLMMFLDFNGYTASTMDWFLRPSCPRKQR